MGGGGRINDKVSDRGQAPCTSVNPPKGTRFAKTGRRNFWIGRARQKEKKKGQKKEMRGQQRWTEIDLLEDLKRT